MATEPPNDNAAEAPQTSTMSDRPITPDSPQNLTQPHHLKTPEQAHIHSPTTPHSPTSSTSSDHDLPTPQDGTTKQSTDGAADRPQLARTQSQASQFSKGRKAIIVFSLCMALFLAALDVTIVTTALPTITSHFHASGSDYTWVGSAYLLAAAASAPVWGKISDIFGRKYIILLANLVFLVGSLVAGISSSIGMLIGARVIQGVGGGGLIILVYVCIGDLFTMRERPKYFGIMGMVWAIASGVGPVIGGAFTEGVSWRWCFYINLPLDGVSLILLFIFLKLDNPRTPLIAGLRSVDWIGVLTIIGGVVMFLFGLESGGITHPWDSAFVLCLIIFGVVAVGLFIVNEWKFAKYPVIPIRIFRDSSNLAALACCFIHGFVFIGGSYYLPLYFQVVLGASPILSGVILFAMVLTFSIMSAGVGIFIKRTGMFREPIIFGMLFMTLGYGLFINLPNHRVWSKIIIYQIITGIGVGPLFQSPLVALQSRLQPHDMAIGTTVFGFTRNLATSISVVLGGVIFQNQLAKHITSIASQLPSSLAASLSSSGFGSATADLSRLNAQQKVLLDDAFTKSLQTIWIFYTAVASVGIVVAVFGIKKKELSRDKVDVKTGLKEMERVRLEEKDRDDERKETKRLGKLGHKDVEKGSVPSSPVRENGDVVEHDGDVKEKHGLGIIEGGGEAVAAAEK